MSRNHEIKMKNMNATHDWHHVTVTAMHAIPLKRMPFAAIYFSRWVESRWVVARARIYKFTVSALHALIFSTEHSVYSVLFAAPNAAAADSAGAPCWCMCECVWVLVAGCAREHLFEECLWYRLLFALASPTHICIKCTIRHNGTQFAPTNRNGTGHSDSRANNIEIFILKWTRNESYLALVLSQNYYYCYCSIVLAGRCWVYAGTHAPTAVFIYSPIRLVLILLTTTRQRRRCTSHTHTGCKRWLVSIFMHGADKILLAAFGKLVFAFYYKPSGCRHAISTSARAPACAEDAARWRRFRARSFNGPI